jgi:hypothetical protein
MLQQLQLPVQKAGSRKHACAQWSPPRGKVGAPPVTGMTLSSIYNHQAANIGLQQQAISGRAGRCCYGELAPATVQC